MLHERVRTALILLAVLVAFAATAAFFEYGEMAIIGLAFVVTGFGAFEFARLFARDEVTERYRIFHGLALFTLTLGPCVTFLPLAILSVKYGNFVIEPQCFALWASWFLLAGFYQTYLSRNDLERARNFASHLWVGMALISICGSAMILFAALPFSYLTMWVLLGIVVASDSAAYFVGKLISGPKIAVAISPNKTFAGAIAGLIAGGLASYIISFAISQGTNSFKISLLYGVVVSFAAQIGDLMKSYLKRVRGVKDTGAILPGHGGILDRCDGVLAGAVAALTGALWS